VKIIALSLAMVIALVSLAFAEQVSLMHDEISETEKSPIYQKYDIVCSVCSSIEGKAELEAALESDMKYAKKYGVINYGRRDGAVQAIKRHDANIALGKAQYSKRYKKKFSKKECNLVYTDDCEGALFEISAKILGKVPWETDDVYPKP